MQSAELIREEISNGKYDDKLLDIYADKSVLEYQRYRYVSAIEKFESLYGAADIEIYSAPGRSEVGGNHTDHQRGQVLAASVNLDVIAVVEKTDNGIVKILSDSFDIAPISVNDLSKKSKEEGTSEGLVRGVLNKLQEAGYTVSGFNAYMTSDVLVGAGLSSSAAFEVAIGTIISGLYNNMEISPVFIAQASQYAENKYFGKPCGLMDQMASSVGSLVNIDFEDPENPIVNKVDVDFDKFGHSLCIVDTKGSHANLTPEYAAIPPEMKAVAKYFGKEYLREVDEKEFFANIADVRKKVGDRPIIRAMHFFNDHNRVTEEVNALNNGDFEEFKKQVNLSGNSSFKYLQNVYPASDITNQAVSIGLAVSEQVLNGKGASRVHGGGFAGTIQAFVPNEMVPEYKKTLDSVFGDGACHVLKVRKYGGMKFC
ncbi:MAG: galactokinase family protein [Lachnospiraceae bacterium]|nr:galactokinase family protein [Lachnospiraceae bacterium]